MFFPEVDKEKTKSNARRKLREYPRWRAVAQDSVSQNVTAQYTFEPRQALREPSRAVERLALNKTVADQELEAIEQAVSRLFDPVHRRILYDKYLKTWQKPDVVIYTELGYERSRYYEMLDNALIAFAEQYREASLVVEKRTNTGLIPD